MVKVVAKPRKLTTTPLQTIIGKTKMINSYLSVEQKNREQQELDRIHNEAGLETEVYSAGYFEGYIGLEPKHPEQHSYWSGYQIGCREYWAKRLGVEIPSEF